MSTHCPRATHSSSRSVWLTRSFYFTQHCTNSTDTRYNIDHSEKLDGLPDEYLTDTLPLAKKIAVALGAENYNILQNNGAIAHQVVNHVHFHVIPKPHASDDEGLVIGWPAKDVNKDELKAFWEQLKGKL
jgi:diadenosine tetraphosphate (Ap4A) HIT family hydrolase